MNTATELIRLRQAVAARLGLGEDEVLNAQFDLVPDYLTRLVEAAWLADAEEAELLALLPAFWAWWRQRWANRDRVVLDKLPALAVVEMRAAGRDLAEIYRAYHGPAAWGDLWPNAVVLEELAVAKRDQRQAVQALKDLFNTPIS